MVWTFQHWWLWECCLPHRAVPSTRRHLCCRCHLGHLSIRGYCRTRVSMRIPGHCISRWERQVEHSILCFLWLIFFLICSLLRYCLFHSIHLTLVVKSVYWLAPLDSIYHPLHSPLSSLEKTPRCWAKSRDWIYPCKLVILSQLRRLVH